jgi:hypothetical protein
MSLLSDELVQKALQVNSAEELITLAKENDIELTKEDAERSFELILQSRQNN